MIGRGEHMEVRTYIESTVNHELSGNVIDLCPVGALVSKPYRFSARAWEMNSVPLISPHDARRHATSSATCCAGRLMRVVPRENEAINEIWIADRDRFSYEGVYSDDRLRRPMVRRGGEWVASDWETALTAASPTGCAIAAPQLGRPGRSLRARSRSCTCGTPGARSAESTTSITACGSAISATRPPTRLVPGLGMPSPRSIPRCAALSSVRTCAARRRCSRTACARRRRTRGAGGVPESGALPLPVPGAQATRRSAGGLGGGARRAPRRGRAGSAARACRRTWWPSSTARR